MKVNLLKATPLEEVEKMLGLELIVDQLDLRGFSVYFDKLEVSTDDGATLTSLKSFDRSADYAIRDYLSSIANKTVVLDAYTAKRKEFKMPVLITHTKLGF